MLQLTGHGVVDLYHRKTTADRELRECRELSRLNSRHSWALTNFRFSISLFDRVHSTGVQVVEIENCVEDQEVRTDGCTAIHRIIGEQHHVAFVER